MAMAAQPRLPLPHGDEPAKQLDLSKMPTPQELFAGTKKFQLSDLSKEQLTADNMNFLRQYYSLGNSGNASKLLKSALRGLSLNVHKDW